MYLQTLVVHNRHHVHCLMFLSLGLFKTMNMDATRTHPPEFVL